ncbi:M60 family metallopeptidase [Elizabethkingia sp. JS20170427COW]|uniref:M60 family metallopeptidase n=1 Tax=Elizabethkingia sp. JS20170427COW TaxID=2583851 RepID=UPI0011108942|nr:M60 family metallopeptidase [Elizabethkingia sp. JS20170427COW]QCX53759.1 hypothetical protein FGE20_08465 [Elizabethkingia sp. JS20170427COW]
MKKINFLLVLGTCVFYNAQDYKMPVKSISSTQTAQSGEGPEKAIDGNYDTIYHTHWYQKGIPDQLDFTFSKRVKSIKLFDYYPRKTGPNGIWINIDIYYSTRSNPNNFTKVNSTSLTWTGDNNKKTFTFPTEIQEPAVIRIAVNAGNGDFSSCAEMEFFSSQELATITSECSFPTDEFSIYKDTKVTPNINGSSATSFQGGENIERSFDGDYTTLYHSTWYPNSNTFPITLNYNFDGNTPLDYILYYPRQDGNVNGNFGNVVISYNTLDHPEFIQIHTQDFQQKNDMQKIIFPQQIKPLNIQIKILDGKNDFASASEIEFYTKNPNAFSPEKYSHIFKDNIFSELQPGVTQIDIDAISSPFFKTVAQCMLNNTYLKKDRVKTYGVYPTVSTIASQYKLSGYDAYENATGIAFEANDYAIIFAKDIPAEASVYLKVRDWANEDNPAEKSYKLENGYNAILLSNGGLAYISYYSDSPFPNTSINIMSGIVNGVYNTQETTDTDWQNMLTNEVYPKIDIVGHYTHLVIDKAPVETFHSTSAQPLIDIYDQITKSERTLMGFYKYNKDTKNRQLVYTESKSGYYAGGMGAHLDLTWGHAASASATGLDLWGVPHELGHVNQIRPNLRWIGTTEVTNNVYSVWVYYNLYNNKNSGIRHTRLEFESSSNANFPSISGGRYGEVIKAGMILNKNYNDVPADGAFRKLIPFWQLQLYYQLAGASKGAPTLFLTKISDEKTNKFPASTVASDGVDYANWYAYVAEKARQRPSNTSNGQITMDFAVDVCDAVQEDLTDFFTKIGFFTPVSLTIEDYSTSNLVVTQ